MRLRSRLTPRSTSSLGRWIWYARQIASSIDRRIFLAVLPFVLAMDLVAAFIVTVAEKPLTLDSLGASLNWSLLTTMGRPPAGYVTTPIGWIMFWVLIVFGVTIIGTITAALVAVVVNFLLKEGQGMGVSGFRDHVVVCGWNGTARDLIGELRRDNARVRIALIHNADRNPAGEGVYYVKGDPGDAGDLRRAGIEDAAAAVVFPLETSGDADMKSILVVLTIQSLAPDVRVVAEVNDPKHVDHFRRAGADEMIVTSHIASRLLARSAVYPGLTNIVADLVSSGGSELYGVRVPHNCVGLSMEEASYRLRTEHQATLLAVRRGGRVHFHAPREFAIREDDDLVVVSENLGRLLPAVAAPGAPPGALRPAPRTAAANGASAALAPATAGSAREERLPASPREASSTPQGG